MTIMELEKSNQEFAIAAADLIDKTGLAWAQYIDYSTGCYCTLGAFRMLIFGQTRIETQTVRVPRYLELVTWFADKLKEDRVFADMYSERVASMSGEAAIGMWNDSSSKNTVVSKLREAGAS